LFENASLGCGKYVCCQLNKEEKSKCMEMCGYVNACKAYPTDFLAFMAGGTNAKIYTDVCVNNYLKADVPLEYDLINPSKFSFMKQISNAMICAISNVINSKPDHIDKFKLREPKWKKVVVNPDDFQEMPENPIEAVGPDPGPLVTDPSPIDLMKQYMNPGNHGNGSKQMFDNNKNGNPFNGKP
jgi:hypothetical protein